MPESVRKIIPADILPTEQYAAERDARRKALVAVKKHRRIEVGPYATFYFENYATMWHQVQEMLFIEKGGAEQLKEELDAYNPLIPQGAELVATLMLEIDEPVRRANVLGRLGAIEEHVFIELGGVHIPGRAADDAERTTPDGKTSSVHFFRFAFTGAEIAMFRGQHAQALLGIAHPNYAHMAVLLPAVRAELAKDFD